MEKLTVFYYSLMEFDLESKVATLHNGLATNTDQAAVLAEIKACFSDPRHISIIPVPELRPIFDEDGKPIGYMGVDLAAAPDFTSYPQDSTSGVENVEVADGAEE